MVRIYLLRVEKGGRKTRMIDRFMTQSPTEFKLTLYNLILKYQSDDRVNDTKRSSSCLQLQLQVT